MNTLSMIEVKQGAASDPAPWANTVNFERVV
jgi:hypothetical protein